MPYTGIVTNLEIGSGVYQIQDERYSKKDLTSRNFIFVTDSYGTYGFVEAAITRLGITGHNVAIGGAGFHGHTGAQTFKDGLQAYVNTLTTAQREAVTDVIVLGGINDMSSTKAQITAAIQVFIEYVKLTLPNAVVGCGAISWINRGTNELASYVDIVVPTYCKAFSSNEPCYYIKDAYLVMHNLENLLNDGLHPNSSGVTELTNWLCNYLKTGESEYIVNNSPTFTAVNGSGSLSFNTYMDSHGVNVVCTGGAFTFTTPKELGSFDTLTQIGTLAGGCLEGHVPVDGSVQSMGSISIPVACRINTASITYDGTLLLMIYDGKISISGVRITASSTYVVTTGIVIQPFSVHVGLLSA